MSVRIATVLSIFVSILLAGCSTTPTRHKYEDNFERLRVNTVLSSWHLAASQGLFEYYFDQMTDDSIFLGTDATERWTKDQFMSYAREPFSDGDGWTYTQQEQHIAFSDDYNTAWVDELLTNAKYGTLRGTAVLKLEGDTWKIAHYSLTFLVPNEKAGAVVEIMKTD